MKKDKRYLVFACNGYYPMGGMSDLQDSFDSLTSVISYIMSDEIKTYDWWSVYDRIDGSDIPSSFIEAHINYNNFKAALNVADDFDDVEYSVRAYLTGEKRVAANTWIGIKNAEGADLASDEIKEELIEFLGL